MFLFKGSVTVSKARLTTLYKICALLVFPWLWSIYVFQARRRVSNSCSNFTHLSWN